MTPEELAAIRARADAATPGPWEAVDGPLYRGEGMNIPAVAMDSSGYPLFSNGDAAFIAHARQDIPALLDEVERLRRKNEAKGRLVRRLHQRLNEVHLTAADLRHRLGAWR